jgi:hypothetical protein
MSFTWAISFGQGWAAVEVLFTIVNGIVLPIERMKKRCRRKQFLKHKGESYSQSALGAY